MFDVKRGCWSLCRAGLQASETDPLTWVGIGGWVLTMMQVPCIFDHASRFARQLADAWPMECLSQVPVRTKPKQTPLKKKARPTSALLLQFRIRVCVWLTH